MRDHGSGTAWRRKDGLWAGQISLGVDADGKRVRRTVYAKTKRLVVERMREVRKEYEETGAQATDRRTTVADYVDQYVAGTLESRVVAGKIKRSTAEWHAAMLTGHVVPALGRKRLEAVTAADVEALLLGLAARSQSLRRGVFTALSRLLATAQRDGLISRNPCAHVERPEPGEASERFLTAAEITALLGAADGRMRAAILVLALTGIRRGELLALRWQDVDLEAGVIDINGSLVRTKADGLIRTTTKSPSSRRRIPLPRPAVDALRPCRALPAAPVFPGDTGTFMEPRSFTRRFEAIAKKAGVDATPHALRHSAATAMVAAGVPLTVVADVLGHGDIRTAAGVYVHTVEAQRRAATDALAQGLEP